MGPVLRSVPRTAPMNGARCGVERRCGAAGVSRRALQGGTVADYKLTELARAAGVTSRAVRYYLGQGLLPAAEFRGGSTRYGEEHLLRLRAIQRLRAEERLRLRAIRVRLAKLSPDEIAALAAPKPQRSAAGAGAALPPSEVGDLVGALWERIPLLPGLELHLRRDAAPLVRRFAAEMRAQCPGAE
jgi:DNA-binding transcriptional MerR regulator